MATATLTDTFSIVIDGPADLNVQKDLAAIRALRIVSIQAVVNNGVATTLSVWKVASGGGAVLVTSNAIGSAPATAPVQGGSWSSTIVDVPLQGPNTTFAATDHIRVLAGTADVVAVIINCIGSPGAAVTVT